VKKTILTLLILCVPLSLRAEYLFLTDGSIIKCSVVRETLTAVTYRVDEGPVLSVPRGEVMRLLYTDITMERISVKLRNGKTLKVFLVDEDRSTYTFRKELYNPAEFTVKRSDVLVMGEIVNEILFTISAAPGIMMPLGNFGYLAGIGFGGSLTLKKNDFFIPRLEGGISLGFNYLTGNDSPAPGSALRSTDSSFFIPVTLRGGYRFTVSSKTFLTPWAGGGAAYLDMPYVERDENTLTEEAQHLKTIGPVGMVGVTGEYVMSESWVLTATLEQGMLFTNDLWGYPYLRLEIGGGMKF
jgi:hypothetical protein